jgi:hypothetical protein
MARPHATIVNMRTSLLVIAGALTGLAWKPARAADVSETQLAPFVLPWDDGTSGPTDVSFLNHVPAGRFGPIRAGADGHLYAGRERVRFLGINLCFGGTVPRKADADRIVARMARFGINVVRFHHTDTQRYPAGLIRQGASRSGELDPEALDRLDFLTSRLKEHGIYSNINLLIGRRFCAADGLPAEIETLDWKHRHTVAIYVPAMIALQKQYARDLLGHRNAYTHLTYAEDPATAFVEINNENGLILHWLAGDLDDLPAPFANGLARQWNAWLASTYLDTQHLRQAWGSRTEPPGAEMLAPLDAPKDRWTLERHAGAVADLHFETDRGTRAARITVEKPGTEIWHVQLNQPGLRVRANGIYTLSFRVKAGGNRSIEVNVGQAHEPWSPLGFSTSVSVTNQWRECRFTFSPFADDDNARVNFSGMGRAPGSVWIADASLRSGGSQGLASSETIEQAAVPIILRRGPRPWPAEARDDFIRFLWDTEQRYWQTMRQCVKDDLGFKGIVIGTIVGCSTPNLQAAFDAVDGHAYWKHPNFPGRPWDPVDWTVDNQSMVNEPGGVLAGLSMQRVEGKPFTITEYNHAAPNTYASEAPLLLAAHAALQDWDAVFLFAYNHSGQWDTRKIPNFFDIDQHPTKMANLPIAALLFRGGHVMAARLLIARDLGARQEPDLIRRYGRPWKQIELDQLGISPALSLLHRTALHVGASFADPTKTDATPPADLKCLVSDTGEITWDRRRPGKGVVTINTSRAKAVIGFADGRSFNLGDVTITPGRTLQDWSTISVSLVEGRSFSKPGRAIIVTTGYAQNTDMGWKNAEHSSVGADWGKAPSLVEIIPVRIRLPVPPQRVECWSLDERGRRAENLAPQADEHAGSIISLGGQKTLWYELTIK